MHLNSNDIFEQIGLVVDPHNVSFQRSFSYSVYLQIQLSQGKHELLQIRSFDSPHHVAIGFCKKHKLNQLAVQIVESKIIEAKRKEEQRIRDESTGKKRRNEMEKSFQRVLEREENRRSHGRIERRAKEAQNKSISRSQSRDAGQIKKKESPSAIPQNRNKSKSPLQKQSRGPSNLSKGKKGSTEVGLQLYNRALIKNKMHENKRIKQQQLKQKEEDKLLTFQPKINPVSAKIVEFRRENPIPLRQREKENKKQSMNQSRENNQEEEMRQCTFKPQINRVSDIIAQNSQAFNNEFDHFNALYRQAQTKKDRLNAEMEKKQDQLFQPKINTRSAEVIKDTFEERLQKSLIQRKKREQNQAALARYSFKPKIGRAPKDTKFNRQAESSVSLWDHLYSQKLKKCQTANQLQESISAPLPLSSATNFYYQNLVEKRIAEVFNALDGDEDGFISPESISVEYLSKNQLMFLRPIFEEMEELDAVLDHNQFKKALTILLTESDPSSKGAFISEKRKIQEKQMFRPQINSKSKQMLMSRIATKDCIYDQLYEQGLKELQKKEYKIQQQRERQEEKQMEGCSFKPQLNNTSKYYIEKVLGKKINQQFDDDPVY